MPQYFEWLIPALPLLGALINASAGDKLSRRAQNRAALMTLVSALLVMLPLLTGQILQPGLIGHPRPLPWIKVWDGQRFLDVPLQIHIDAFSTAMALVVLGVGIAVLSYVASRLKQDRNRHLALAVLNGIVASLVLLILADNLLCLFLGWSVSGWCTHQLARQAQRDAPVVIEHSDNADLEAKQGSAWAGGQLLLLSLLSDLCLLAAIALTSQHLASLSVDDLQALTPPGLAGQARPQEWVAPATLLVLSVTVRTAQFVWYVTSAEILAPGQFVVHALTWCLTSAYLLARTLPIWREASKRTPLLSWWSAASAVLMAVAALGIGTRLGPRRWLGSPAAQRLPALVDRIARGYGLRALYNRVTRAAASVRTAMAKGTSIIGVGWILQQRERLLRRGSRADDDWDGSVHLSALFVLLGAGIILAYLLLQ